jgi:hypothetical protein
MSNINTAKSLNPVIVPTNCDDYINTTDIIKALESAFMSMDQRASLQKFLDQIKDYVADWEWGETLIRDTEFTNYTQELAADISPIDLDSWPATCIDWDHAANELKYDYAEVDFDGISYYGRMG